MPCCDEDRCRRRKPILIRRGWLSGRWYAITDYVPARVGSNLIDARQKHDVTDELVPALIDAGWTPPPSESASGGATSPTCRSSP